MEPASIVILIIIAAATLAWVGYPFVIRSRRASVSQQEQDELRVAYERILRSIRDLDEDFSTGKITEDAYQEEREEWAQRGVVILKQMHGDAPSDAIEEDEETDEALDDAIEQAIAAYRQAKVEA